MTIDEFLVKFPTYTLWAPEGPSPLILRGGGMMMIPVFTDFDSVYSYRKREKIGRISILEFESPAELVDYLTVQPTPNGLRPRNPDVSHVLIDPMTNEQARFTIFPVDDFVRGLSQWP